MDQAADDGRGAVPGVAPEPELGPAMRLECDGEVFDVGPGEFGGTQYDWVSGLNPGYGFASSPATDDVEHHRTSIRHFLAMIDPRTGYIAED